MAQVKMEYVLEIDKARASLDKLNSEFDKLSQSQKENTAELKKVNKEFNNLSKTEKESSETGKKLVAQRKELTLSIMRQREESNKLKKSIKDELKNGKTQVNSIKALREANNQLVAERDRLNTQSEKSTKRFKDLTTQIDKNEISLKKYDAAIGRNQRNVGNYKGAIKEVIDKIELLKKENIKLLATQKKVATSTIKGKAEYSKIENQIKKNTNTLKEYDKQIQRSQRNVGNYGSSLKNLAKTLATGLGFYALISAIKSSITMLGNVDEEFANVRKTTGLTQDEVKDLTKELQKLNTRTSVQGLLQIATAAGRMNIAKEDLKSFTEVADKAFVALAGELSGSADEIATDLAKISSVFGLETEFGVAEGINKIGSAVNFLGANTKAQAQPIVDFTKSMQGIAGLAKIGVGDIMGLGAAFDELGQDVMVSGTSTSQLLVLMGKKTEEFAKIAGLELGEFSDLLKRDANEALFAFAEGVGKSGIGLESLATQLDGLGLQGKKVVGTIGVLATKTDTFRNAQKLANDEVERGTSLTNEFNEKNNTLNANLDKTVKNLTNIVVNSGFLDWLRKLTSLMVEASEVNNQLSESQGDFGKALNKYSADELQYRKSYLEGQKKIRENESQRDKNLRGFSRSRSKDIDIELKELDKLLIKQKEIEDKALKSNLKKEVLDLADEISKAGESAEKMTLIDPGKDIENAIQLKDKLLKERVIYDGKYLQLLKLRDKEGNKINIQNAKDGFDKRYELFNDYINKVKQLEEDYIPKPKDEVKKDEVKKETGNIGTDIFNKEIERIKNQLKAEETLKKAARDAEVQANKEHNSKLATAMETFLVTEKDKSITIKTEQMEQLDLLRDSKLISDLEFKTLEEQLEQEHQDRLTQIEIAALTERQKNEISFNKTTATAMGTMFGDLAVAVVTSQEELGKTVGKSLVKMLNSIIDAYLAKTIAAISFESLLDFGTSLAKIAPAIGIATTAKGLLSAIKFEDGGVVKLGKGGIAQGKSHKQGGINLLKNGQNTGIEIEGKEAILTKGVTENPALLAQASAINIAGGGSPLISGGSNLASGGVVSVPTISNAQKDNSQVMLNLLSKINNNILNGALMTSNTIANTDYNKNMVFMKDTDVNNMNESGALKQAKF